MYKYVQSRTHEQDLNGSISTSDWPFLNIPMEDKMYQKFYLTTPQGEKELRKRLEEDPEQVKACRKRLGELDQLLKSDENRCHVSKDQRNFLRRMLLPYSN